MKGAGIQPVKICHIEGGGRERGMEGMKGRNDKEREKGIREGW